MNYMTLGMENMLTIFLAIIGTVIVLYAQLKIQSNYRKYKMISCKKNLTGFDVARMILDQNGLNHVHIVEISGELTDHYDPTRKVVRLSKDIFHNNSIASISVAAHECGHAIQDKENYSFMRIRASLVPFVNFISSAGFLVILISLVAGITGYLIYGILMILVTLLFQLVTLPVEFDASKRALDQLKKLDLVDQGEIEGATNVLKAAALTYVASVISSILSLLRLIIMYRDEKDR